LGNFFWAKFLFLFPPHFNSKFGLIAILKYFFRHIKNLSPFIVKSLLEWLLLQMHHVKKKIGYENTRGWNSEMDNLGHLFSHFN